VVNGIKTGIVTVVWVEEGQHVNAVKVLERIS
jgi:hypothetical protein